MRSLVQSVRGRVWSYRGWQFYGIRPYLWPFLSGDEYMRRTLVIPVIVGHVVVALWFSIDPEDFQMRAWARWYRLHRAGGRLSCR